MMQMESNMTMHIFSLPDHYLCQDTGCPEDSSTEDVSYTVNEARSPVEKLGIIMDYNKYAQKDKLRLHSHTYF